MSPSARYPSLQGRVVFISGGASGIGAAFVEQFRSQGAKVGFVDLDAAAADALIERLRNDGASESVSTPFFVRCDVTDTQALQAAISATRELFGPISVLVNNAANDQRHRIEDVTPEYWDRCMAVNLRHQFFAAQAVVDDMEALGGGSIINLGSTGWMNNAGGYPGYATAKAAVHGLTKTLARDFGKRNIRVNALVPGWVMTERQLKMWVDPSSEKLIDESQCLPGRLHADDIAAMALFLASDDSRMCTAQSFIVNAGWA